MRFFRDRPIELSMQEPRRSKSASCAVARQSTSGISPGNLNTASQPYASSAKTSCLILGKGGKKDESKMPTLRKRTQPRSLGLQRLFRAGEMLFVQCHDGSKDDWRRVVFNKHFSSL